MGIKKLSLKHLPILVLAILIIAASILSIKVVQAGGTDFAETDCNWDYYSNEMKTTKEETYPYNAGTYTPSGAPASVQVNRATINSVSLDVLYGTTRNLVIYHGELPYEQIYNDDDEQLERWEGYYAEDGTSVTTNSNPSYGAATNPGIKEFWGGDDSFDWSTQVNKDGNFESVAKAEAINQNSTVSLRLYALSHTKTGFMVWLGNALYWIAKGLGWIATFLISLIVRAKNLDMDMIMDVLKLKNLNESLTKNFLWDAGAVKLSAFTAFCIIALIFTLAAFTIRWVKGANQTKGIWEIIGTVGLGLLIIGMCLTNRLDSLGSSVSNMASQVMYAAANSLTSSGSGKAFEIDVKDSSKDTEICQMCEMAMVNKAYIDLQLCVQFDVSKVDDLKFSNLGDNAAGTTAKSYLSGVSNADMSKDFNGNLGYYYWFANSSAVEKTSLNKTYPDTNSAAVTNKLSSMITYLQVLHNKGGSNQKKIEGIVGAFANPHAAKGFFTMLLFTIALIIMGIVLLKYALNVLIAKLELFVALLGMILAGPLILSSSKKLVDTGKAILGMLVVAFLEITVYSIIFDVIIYAVSSMFAPNIPTLLAIIAFLLLLLKFNPIIAQKIKMILEKTERGISPALSDGKRAMKNWARRKAAEGIRAYDNSQKVVGYDAQGNAIMETRGGNALSKLMHQGANTLEEGNARKGFLKINSETNAMRDRNTEKTASQKRKAYENAVDETMKTIDSEAEHTANMVNVRARRTEDEAFERDDNGEITGYKREGMNDEELARLDGLTNLETEIEALKDSDEYKALVQQKHDIEERNSKLGADDELEQMDKEAESKLLGYQMKINAKKTQLQNEAKALQNQISDRARRNAYHAEGLDYDAAKGKDEKEKLENASRIKAQNAHKDELEQVLTEAIKSASDDVNDVSLTKIGSKSGSRLNQDAVSSQAAAMLQLDQLKKGEAVSKTQDAKIQMKEAVESISRQYDGDTAHMTEDASVEAAKAGVRNARHFSAERKEAKAELKEAKADRKENIEQQKADDKAMYKTAKKEAGGGTVLFKTKVQEQLQSAINNREAGQAPTPGQTAKPQNNGKNAPGSQAATTHSAAIPTPVATPPSGQAPRRSTTPDKTNTRPSNQAPKSTPPGRSTNPDKTPKPTARGREIPKPTVDMDSVINKHAAPTVSAQEQRQADARNMSNIIEERTQSISHSSEATRADYSADEQKMDAYRQDRRIVSDKVGSSGKQ